MISSISSSISRTQGISNAAAQINDAAASAASKRKELAVEQLKALRERLHILMLLSSAAGKGTAASAAQIAKEVATAVKEYASAAGVESSTSNAVATGLAVLSKQDAEFLSSAKQLSAQVKSILAVEAKKAKLKHAPEELHQKEVGLMDAAISDAEKSLGKNSTATPAVETSVAGFYVLA